jgi:1-acyl-sn-glycerol-3-phosphate acyltransferase
MTLDRVFHILYCIVWPFFNLCHPVRAIGKEHIPDGPVVICPNHSALSDPLFVVFAFGYRYPIRAMAKAELMRIPVLGWILSKAGVFGVERGSADVGAVKKAIKVLKDGDKLLIFPEGTRVGEGESVEAKTGAAMMAVRTGTPLLPVYIPVKKRWFAPTTVVIGEPYQPQVAGRKGTPEEYHAIANDLMDRVHTLGEQAQ